MAHLHLRLFAERLQSLAEDYLNQVNWLHVTTAANLDSLLGVMDHICSKPLFESQRSLAFEDVVFCREIIHFYDPVHCCQKLLWASDTLMSHFLSHRMGGNDGRIESCSKKLAILFSLYLQLGMSIMVRYDQNYEMMEQFTVHLLRKAAGYLDCIRNKPLRRDAQAADTVTHQTTFAKWKLVFDYTCATCCDSGVDQRYNGAIAWFKIHQTTLMINSIRHLGSKMHAASMRNVSPDRIIPMLERLSLQESPLEINNNPQWSKAAKYLLEIRENELDELCDKADRLQRDSRLKDVRDYLMKELDPLLTNVSFELFGSYVFGVADEKSDLDLRITSNTDEKTAFLKAFKWANSKTTDVTLRAQIPTGPMLLTVFSQRFGLNLDLTFASPYIVANAKLIEYFFRLQPMGRKLFFLLKGWKKLVGFSLKFHNHVIVTMIIFYMQQEKYLPTIVPLLVGPVMLNNNTWNTNFVESSQVFAKPTNFLIFVKNFFAFWSEFNWTKNGICVSDGQVRPKESFRIASKRTSIPPMMASDYFEQSRNVASNVQVGDHWKLVKAIKEAVQILENEGST